MQLISARSAQPWPELVCHTRGKVADVMLRFSWPKPFDRTTGQKRRAGRRRKEGNRSGEEERKVWWWLGAQFYSGNLNRSVERKGKQFQFVMNSGNNPGTVMDQRTNITWMKLSLLTNATYVSGTVSFFFFLCSGPSFWKQHEERLF